LRPFSFAMRIAFFCAAAVVSREKCVPVTTMAAADAMKLSSIEDQREGILVPDAENHERGEALLIGDNAARRDALALHLLTDEAAHGLVAYAGHEARFQAEPSRADGDVRGAPADRLGEGGHVLQPTTHLLAVEIDRGAANGDHIQGWLHAIPPAPGLINRVRAALGSCRYRTFILLPAYVGISIPNLP
jgi:hypothetical protein